MDRASHRSRDGAQSALPPHRVVGGRVAPRTQKGNPCTEASTTIISHDPVAARCVCYCSLAPPLFWLYAQVYVACPIAARAISVRWTRASSLRALASDREHSGGIDHSCQRGR